MPYKIEQQEKIEQLKKQKDITILSIETSCDETAAAVVKNGREVLANAVYTQIAIHTKFGGVVPEIASRNHLEKLPFVVDSALKEANMSFSEIDAIAVTQGPGLVGALLTGVSYAKALSYALKKPLIPVNHMEGHISANFITYPSLTPPFICLVVSGGHTEIVKLEKNGEYTLLGSTRDDAAGEAFDKVARVIGLPYPGGPNLQKLAEKGDASRYQFPRSFRGETHLDFSFSGLKTAVINLVHNMEERGETFLPEDIAASFQKTVVEILVKNAFLAVEREKMNALAIAGGVSANTALRELAEKTAKEKGVTLYLPDFCYCTDNAAMIGAAAYYTFRRGVTASLALNADPSMKLL